MRKRENRIIGVGMLVLLLVLSSQTVWANSSWVWLTDRQPYQLLPAAAALTVLIETVMIKTCLGIQKTGKVLGVVLAGNLLSFCLPYLFIWLEGREMGFRGFAEIIEKGPQLYCRDDLSDPDGCSGSSRCVLGAAKGDTGQEERVPFDSRG